MIQPTSNILGYTRTDALASATRKPLANSSSAGDAGDRLSSTNTDAVREALANTPELRPEVVARGHHLAVDPNYPPRELIARLAKLMVESRDPSAE